MDFVPIKCIYDIFCLYNFTFVYLVDYLNDVWIIRKKYVARVNMEKICLLIKFMFGG